MEILYTGIGIMFIFIGFGLMLYCIMRAADGKKLW